MTQLYGTAPLPSKVTFHRRGADDIPPENVIPACDPGLRRDDHPVGGAVRRRAWL